MNQYYTLSELLYDARMSKQLSISQVEKMTHIRAEYIEALENSDYEVLPADVYVRGILKNYAAFLRLPYEEVISLYRKDGILAGKDVESEKQSLKITQKMKVFHVGKFLFGFLFVIILGVIGFYVFGNYNLLRTPPTLIIERPTNEYENSNVKDIVISGIIESEAELFINEQKVFLQEDGSFHIPYTLQEGENVIEFVGRSTRTQKETRSIRTIFYTPPAIEVAHTVIVETRSIAVWIEVEDDSGVVFSQNIEAGESKTFQSSGKLVIRSRDAAHTYLTVDGKDQGPMGSEDTDAEVILEK